MRLEGQGPEGVGEEEGRVAGKGDGGDGDSIQRTDSRRESSC